MGVTVAQAGISIHAPHARSDDAIYKRPRQHGISIHAPHARSDPATPMRTKWSFISIHAPHARSDQCVFAVRCFPQYFNPRSSCEERLLRHARTGIYSKTHFNPRSSCEERRLRELQ